MSDDTVLEREKTRSAKAKSQHNPRPDMGAAENLNEELTTPPVVDLLESSMKVIPEKKALHLVLQRAALERLEYLKARVQPGTQTSVIVKALQLFDYMFREHENGTMFYIQRPGKDPEPLKVFN